MPAASWCLSLRQNGEEFEKPWHVRHGKGRDAGMVKAEMQAWQRQRGSLEVAVLKNSALCVFTKVRDRTSLSWTEWQQSSYRSSATSIKAFEFLIRERSVLGH